MSKASYGPTPPATTESKGSINHVPVQSTVRSTRELPERKIEHKDGSVVTRGGNVRTDH